MTMHALITHPVRSHPIPNQRMAMVSAPYVPKCGGVPGLVQHARLVGGNHVFDVDEGVLAAVQLKQLQRLRDQVAQGLALDLAVVNTVAKVLVGILEDVEDRQDLPVVWHQRLADHFARNDHLLQHLKDGADDLRIPRVERRLDRDDQLRDNGQDLGAAVLQHVKDALDRKKAVRLLLLADAIEKDGKVVVIVELLNVHLPADAVVNAAVLDLNGQVPTLVEAA
mmetsp:Transcript_35192/g.113355  ORF Transcript_35192/g.113355 Transcript_35192/m.113355 type:complete len:224 (+) Transcript_35192:85-756(+)